MKDTDIIRYTVEVEVDGLRGINHYTIKAMYNKAMVASNGWEYSEIAYKLIDEFDYSWDEIERDGGIAQINKDLKECYGDNCMTA